MAKLKTIVTGVIVVAAVASLLIQRRGETKLRENDALLEQRGNQLTEFVAENQRLSNRIVQAELLVQAKADGPRPDDRTAELSQLRAKVEALRQQTNQLALQLAQNRRVTGTRFYSLGDSNLLEHSNEKAITFAGGPRATGKLNDARALAAALRTYADEHQGEFPSSLDAVAVHVPKPLDENSPPWANGPLTGTNDFEIVYQGAQSDLSNIPPRRVALIRERQPWLTPDGKWARVYGYADGAASIVESDDNFQSWDAQHIIPARAVPH